MKARKSFEENCKRIFVKEYKTIVSDNSIQTYSQKEKEKTMNQCC